MRISIVFAQLLVATPLASGFLNEIFGISSIKPDLAELVDSQKERRLSLNLDIGQDNDKARIAITGLTFDLFKEKANYDHIKMPGKDGGAPQLSSGIRTLNLIKEGHFISHMGTEMVKTVKGCWEMVWRKDAPTGVLLCGFEVPEEYMRNDAKLPKGQMYMSFPTYTKDTLAAALEDKGRILQMAKEHLEEKDQWLEKMQQTPNPLMKALHYRNAYAAAEKYWLLPIRRMKLIPEMDQVIPFEGDLMVSTNGLVWNMLLPNGRQTILGEAKLAPVIEG